MSLHAFTSNARQYISKRRVNRESHSAILERLIFMYHLEYQIVLIPSWLHSTFKDLSNEYSHAQIQVKMKKLWPRQVGEEKQVAVRKVCRDQENMSRQEVCRDQAVCRDKKVCRDRKYVVTGSMSRPSSMSRPVSRPSKLSRPVSRPSSMSRPESFVETKKPCRDQKR